VHLLAFTQVFESFAWPFAAFAQESLCFLLFIKHFYCKLSAFTLYLKFGFLIR
jgi:hypothetical protein